MNYEQKYKDALERAKKWHNAPNADKIPTFANRVVEEIFPELRESEDERTRKELTEFLKITSGGFLDTITQCKTFGKWVAWLEKQDKKHLENYGEAEKEKVDFVSDGFIECHADFLDFKEGNTYWLEYIGDDKYNVRSDNLLGKTYHITPCQLYTVFKKLTWLEKQGEQKSIWHNEDEEPQRGSLILLIMQSGIPIVAKVVEPNHTFNHGERWAYIDDLFERQGENTLIEEIKRRKELLISEKEKETSLNTKLSLGGRIAMLEELLVFANEKQCEQKPTDEEMKEILRTEYEKGRADAIAETQVAWSEEDEETLDSILNDLRQSVIPDNEDIGWLKSLKQRITNKQ